MKRLFCRALTRESLSTSWAALPKGPTAQERLRIWRSVERTWHGIATWHYFDALYGRWNADRTEKQHFFGQVTFSDCDSKYELLYLTRRALQAAKDPQVSYEVDVAALDGADAGLGDTVSVVDTSRTPEWRFKARIVKRVRTFSDCVLSRVTIGKVQRTAYSSVSTLSNDVAALANDVVGIDGQLSAAASTENIAASVEGAVDTAVENLNDLGESEF